MVRPRRSRRTSSVILTLIILSVAMISLDESGRTHNLVSGVRSIAADVFEPVRAGVDHLINPIGNFFAGAVHYGSLEQENHRLESENGQLRQEIAQKTGDAAELAQLQALQANDRLPWLNGISFVSAGAETLETSNFAATILIDKGRQQGVTVGDPVIGGGGLVGSIVQSSRTTAVVRLLTDAQSRVGVTFGHNEFATVQGIDPGRPMTADFVTTGEHVTKGEKLYTDSLDDAAFPPGIPVATVEAANPVTGSDEQSVQVQPIADLTDLAYVQVLQWDPTP